MSGKVFLWTVILIASIFVAAVSQILLKISVNTGHEGFIREYLNFRVIAAYALLFSTTIITVLALRYVPLYVAASIEALSQVFVALLGRLILKENVNIRKCIGLLVILVGVIIICL